MSYAEEQPWFGLEDLALEAEQAEQEVEHIKYIITLPAWRMADGELIAIKAMTTDHIKNCMKMIYKKHGTWRREYLKYFKAELRKRKWRQ